MILPLLIAVLPLFFKNILFLRHVFVLSSLRPFSLFSILRILSFLFCGLFLFSKAYYAYRHDLFLLANVKVGAPLYMIKHGLNAQRYTNIPEWAIKVIEKMGSRKEIIEFYEKFGKDAILNCEWCFDHGDYMMYYFYELANNFFQASLFLGLVTAKKSSFFRFVGMLLFLLLYFFDILQVIAEENFIRLFLKRFMNASFVSTYTMFSLFRFIISFLIILICVLLEKKTPTYAERTRNAIQNAKFTISVLRYLNEIEIVKDVSSNHD